MELLSHMLILTLGVGQYCCHQQRCWHLQCMLNIPIALQRCRLQCQCLETRFRCFNLYQRSARKGVLLKYEEAKVELVQMLVQNICSRRASLVVIIGFPRHVIILSLIRARSLTRRSMKKNNKKKRMNTTHYYGLK